MIRGVTKVKDKILESPLHSYRVYKPSRAFHSERVPGHIQNIVIRDSFFRKELYFLLSSAKREKQIFCFKVSSSSKSLTVISKGNLTKYVRC